jgi:microcystin-dependent protein
MNNCDNCNPCPPCDNQVPTTCEPLPISTSPIRIVVEDQDSCKGTIQQPLEPSLLLYDENNEIAWKDGSVGNPINLPQLQINTTSASARLSAFASAGTLSQWQPSNTGDRFIGYWDGTNWRIANLAALLPAGNGVLIKTGGTLSFISGADGDVLQIIGGSIQFNGNITGGVPTGTIMPYPATTLPAGWVLCNGALYGRTALDLSPEPNLFAVIGTTYGAGDGLTTFAVPDLRGMFIRGLDSGRGIDPLRTLGSQQGFGMESHNHGGVTGSESGHTHSFSGTTGGQSADHTHFTVNTTIGSAALTSSNYVNRGFTGGSSADYALKGSPNIPTLGQTTTQSTNHTHSYSGTSGAGTSHSHTIQNQGAAETRPVNVAMNYIIKT